MNRDIGVIQNASVNRRMLPSSLSVSSSSIGRCGARRCAGFCRGGGPSLSPCWGNLDQQHTTPRHWKYTMFLRRIDTIGQHSILFLVVWCVLVVVPPQPPSSHHTLVGTTILRYYDTTVQVTCTSATKGPTGWHLTRVSFNNATRYVLDPNNKNKIADTFHWAHKISTPSIQSNQNKINNKINKK